MLIPEHWNVNEEALFMQTSASDYQSKTHRSSTFLASGQRFALSLSLTCSPYSVFFFCVCFFPPQLFCFAYPSLCSSVLPLAFTSHQSSHFPYFFLPFNFYFPSFLTHTFSLACHVDSCSAVIWMTVLTRWMNMQLYLQAMLTLL